jgi:hypothetical protein
LRKEKRALQAEREGLELEVERKLDEERTQLVSSTTERVEDAYRMKLREKDPDA